MLFAAFAGNAGAHDLGQAVDIIDLAAQLLLDFLTHALRARFGAEDGAFQLEVIGLVTHLQSLVGNRQRVAGRAGKALDAEIG